jgi:hypothetical protein
MRANGTRHSLQITRFLSTGLTNMSYVLKRDGRKQPVAFDKVTDRIKALCTGLAPEVDPVSDSNFVCINGATSNSLVCHLQVMIAQKVISGIFPGVTTSQLDELSAETGELYQKRCCWECEDSLVRD